MTTFETYKTNLLAREVGLTGNINAFQKYLDKL